ncbi:MAG: cell division protein FtsB [Gammaproteobacteria bacterium]|nr:cell division protein FtsB [Gammaproteobacteria bacterium]MDH5803343.1 cell division protein FtsB [Gammaproteobacteria bacterium]
MKALITILVLLLAVLQFKLWFGDGNLREVWLLRDAIEAQKVENQELRRRNAALEAEVQDLKKGLEAVEERARSELGMIKKDETFFQVIERGSSTTPVPGRK